MATVCVTQGADQRVPISGQLWPGLRGQVTCRRSMATGAARSEPRAPLGRPHARRVPGTLPGGCRVGARCTQGARWCHGRHRVRAPPGWGRVHIRRCHAIKAGQGRGKDGVRQCQSQCQSQCPDSAITDTRHPPNIRHPAPETRHPAPHKYPGYLVTRCWPLAGLLLLYPISAKVGYMAL